MLKHDESVVVGLARRLLHECERDSSSQDSILLLGQLATLLRDPHDFLHEFVSVNWEHGALLSVIESGILERLSSAHATHVEELARDSALPVDKLLRILRLLSCRGLVSENTSGYFEHTTISETLVADPKFKAWVAFQLFETRVASAHLAQSLRQQPNEYGTASSAFKHAFGCEMYEWHSQHPSEGKRFAMAMQGVSQSLDPADALYSKWFEALPQIGSGHVLEIGGRYGFASAVLAARFPLLKFEIQGPELILHAGRDALEPEVRDKLTFVTRDSYRSPHITTSAPDLVACIIRNILWNWSDEDAVGLLRSLVPLMQKCPGLAILISDGISPDKDAFPSNVEIAYRRRDLTMMTMHNVKQRTQAEWMHLFHEACPDFEISSKTQASSHVFKGLWELRLKGREV